MNIKTRNTCRICGNPNLKPVVDLGNQYFQGAFLKDGFPKNLIILASKKFAYC